MILQILIILFFPLLWIYLTRRWKIEQWLSPVVLSYLTGIILANINFLPLSESISHSFSEYTIVLAIPLLLYSTNLPAWYQHAKRSVLAFGLCILSGILCSIIAAFVFQDSIADSGLISGMLVGVYTGGTPNMNAIGLAMGADSETLVLMNAADIFCGGICLIFLTSIAHPVFSKILPAFQRDKSAQELVSQKEPIQLQQILLLLGLTLGIIALTIGLTLWIFGDLKQLAFILLLLTSFSIGASFFAQVRAIKISFEIGEYLLLMFCIAIGMQANFSTLLADGSTIISFTAFVLSLTILLHLLLSKIFKIDVDTMMITATAALYGPVFIGQIATTIKNRSLIVSGMATGLVGYAIGNYLGVSITHLLRYWLG